MGNNWWFDKFAIPYADYCSGNLWDHGKTDL
jgi:hypothetical protein